MAQQKPQQPNSAELLCPAGDPERLHAAVLFGADAVYLSGKRFGMRSAPQNFTERELCDAVGYVHAHGKKAYVTCNTLFSNRDADSFAEFVRLLSSCGADAVIVSDLGALRIAGRTVPELARHVSVQTGVYNYAAAQMLFELGASRVILSRELSAEQIAEIREKTDPALELEAFVHGSICVSFSGRCLLSEYMTGRSASFGDCTQPCRWKYHLMEEKRPGEFYPVLEDDEGSYILNARDLCLIRQIPELIRIGVTSLKIEGRAKSAYYAAVTANAYRAALDYYAAHPVADWTPPAWTLRELETISHRPYSTGFFYGREHAGQEYENGGYLQDYLPVGVAENWENGRLTFSGRNKLTMGETVELLLPGKEPIPLAVTAVFDAEGQSLTEANCPQKRFVIPCEREIPAGAILRKKA